jgi:hypothetical protein
MFRCILIAAFIQAAFLELCAKHRDRFLELAIKTTRLVKLRQNAEDVLIETGDLKVPDWEEIFAEEGSKHE